MKYFGWRMKTLVQSLVIAGCLLAIVPISHGGPSTNLAQDNPVAHRVVQGYFHSLRTADLDGLSSLFGTRENRKTKKSFLTPGYSRFLSDRYRAAHFSITDYTIDFKWIVVDIEIQMKNSETIRERLYLKKNGAEDSSAIKIVSREQLLN